MLHSTPKLIENKFSCQFLYLSFFCRKFYYRTFFVVWVFSFFLSLCYMRVLCCSGKFAPAFGRIVIIISCGRCFDAWCMCLEWECMYDKAIFLVMPFTTVFLPVSACFTSMNIEYWTSWRTCEWQRMHTANKAIFHFASARRCRRRDFDVSFFVRLCHEHPSVLRPMHIVHRTSYRAWMTFYNVA